MQSRTKSNGYPAVVANKSSPPAASTSIKVKIKVPKDYNSFVCSSQREAAAFNLLQHMNVDAHVKSSSSSTSKFSIQDVPEEHRHDRQLAPARVKQHVIGERHRQEAVSAAEQQRSQSFFGSDTGAEVSSVPKFKIKRCEETYVIQKTPEKILPVFIMPTHTVTSKPTAMPKSRTKHSISFFRPSPIARVQKEEKSVPFSPLGNSNNESRRSPSFVFIDGEDEEDDRPVMKFPAMLQSASVVDTNGFRRTQSVKRKKSGLFACNDEYDDEVTESDDETSEAAGRSSSLSSSLSPVRRPANRNTKTTNLNQKPAGKTSTKMPSRRSTNSHATSSRSSDTYSSTSSSSSTASTKTLVPSSRERPSEMDENGEALIALPQSARNAYMRPKRLQGSVWEEIALKLVKRSQPFPFNKWRAGNFVPSRSYRVYGGEVKVLKTGGNVTKFLEGRSKNLKKISHQCNDLCVDYDDITTDQARFGLSPWLNILMLGYHRIYALERFSTITRPRVIFITKCGVLLVNEKDVEQILKRTKSTLPQQLFSFDPTCDPALIFVSNEHTTVLIADISNGLCRVPIAVVAQKDEEENFKRAQAAAAAIQTDFRFIKGAVLDKSLVNTVKISDICMCDCVDGQCIPGKCPCTKPHIAGFDEMTEAVYKSAGSGSGSSPFYHGRILSKHPYGVFECSAVCSCRGRCPATVCADHLMPNLQIFQTAKCDFGVRVLHDVPSGSFVCSYDGIICEEDKFQDNNHYPYTFGLDYIEVALTPEEGEKFRKTHGFKQYTMDAEKVGGVARFFNHSCNPNLFVQNVFSGHRDARFPRLAFITGRCVYAGEELTWNYGYQVGCMGADKIQDCFCGAEECSGRLF